jgi:nucleotide-binding universal stress UspA family protein
LERDAGPRARSTPTEERTMPAPYEKIAVFLEEGPAAERALAEAAALRALSPGELHVVHVAARPYPLFAGLSGYLPLVEEDTSHAESWLEERTREIPAAVGVVLRGWPPAVACEYVAEHGIDLLVAGAHRGIVERAMLGGFASYVAYHAGCPVLLVHPSA